MHMINSESQNNALCEESNKMEESNRMDQSFEMSRSVSGINPQTRKNLVVYIGVALATVVLIVCIVLGLASTETHNVGKYYLHMWQYSQFETRC